jgi:uncharacterized membrane protein YccC
MTARTPLRAAWFRSQESVFFSEEKNQKTFMSALVPIIRPWPGSVRLRRIKRLLVLFFRKEHPFFACALAYALSELVGLKEGYWAIITAIVVTQPDLDQTIQASRTRIVGTLIGAACGFLVLLAVQHGLPRLVLFWCALVPLAMMTAVSQSFRLSCITLTVVVLIPATGPPFARPLDRVFGILIGAAASVAVLAISRIRPE